MTPETLEGRPWLFVGAGWQWDDAEIWALTKRARANVAFMAGQRGDARRRNWREHDMVGAIEGAEGYLPFNLPIIIVCPTCRTPQRLEPASLGVDANLHQHRPTWSVGVDRDVHSVLCCSEGRLRGYPHAALKDRRLP